MSQKKVKAVRKQVRKQKKKIVQDFLRMVQYCSFKKRFSFAWTILFLRPKKKLKDLSVKERIEIQEAMHGAN
jgi:hypothetical protein